MKFTEEELLKNWDTFINLIKDHISEPRKTSLIKMYEEFQEDLMLAPASGNENYHNCFIGGYIDHVIRVVNCSIKLHDVWGELGADITGFTKEELIFSAINHDLGKAGASKVLHINNSAINTSDSQVLTRILNHVADTAGAQMVIFSNDLTAKAVAPRLAARMKAGFVPGAVDYPNIDGGSFSVNKNV